MRKETKKEALMKQLRKYQEFKIPTSQYIKDFEECIVEEVNFDHREPKGIRADFWQK
jgi:hypothetical protein